MKQPALGLGVADFGGFGPILGQKQAKTGQNRQKWQIWPVMGFFWPFFIMDSITPSFLGDGTELQDHNKTPGTGLEVPGGASALD